MKRILITLSLITLSLVLAACSSPTLIGQGLPDLQQTTGSELEELLIETGRPAVVNVWASWCGPCRSEAALFDAAHEQFGTDVTFIGVAVEDSQPGAKDFLATFGLTFDQFFDPDRSVPHHFGGIGTPITFFFDKTGTLIETHLGVIDERALALGIDEIVNG